MFTIEWILMNTPILNYFRISSFFNFNCWINLKNILLEYNTYKNKANKKFPFYEKLTSNCTVCWFCGNAGYAFFGASACGTLHLEHCIWNSTFGTLYMKLFIHNSLFRSFYLDLFIWRSTSNFHRMHLRNVFLFIDGCVNKNQETAFWIFHILFETQ